jgi:hypothetical protein
MGCGAPSPRDTRQRWWVHDRWCEQSRGKPRSLGDVKLDVDAMREAAQQLQVWGARRGPPGLRGAFGPRCGAGSAGGCVGGGSRPSCRTVGRSAALQISAVFATTVYRSEIRRFCVAGMAAPSHGQPAFSSLVSTSLVCKVQMVHVHCCPAPAPTRPLPTQGVHNYSAFMDKKRPSGDGQPHQWHSNRTCGRLKRSGVGQRRSDPPAAGPRGLPIPQEPRAPHGPRLDRAPSPPPKTVTTIPPPRAAEPGLGRLKRRKPHLVERGIKPERTSDKNVRHLWKLDVIEEPDAPWPPPPYGGAPGGGHVRVEVAGNGFLYRWGAAPAAAWARAGPWGPRRP